MNLRQLGPYEIIGQLGRGGMGTVYRAKNTHTGEEAAIKVLVGPLAMDEGFRERFEAEIETLKMLRHPNIVRLLGYGEQDGVLFYAMELVEGTSLDVEIRKGRKFTWEEVLQIGIQAARGLKHAHDRGIIHRDIKPANLMLRHDGVLKISDFGIAKLFGNTGMTSAGGVIGTAEYMSPEQADGKLVSHRSDLYSLGAVLYCLFAGRPPFVSKSIAEVLQMQRFATPEPLRRFVPDIPEEIERIIFELLEKDPQQRIANATLLARRLQATLHGLKQQEWELQQKKQAKSSPTAEGATVAADQIPEGETAGFSLSGSSQGDPEATIAAPSLSQEPNEPTLAATEVSAPGSEEPTALAPTRPDTQSPGLQQETQAATAAASSGTSVPAPPTQAHFTEVREEELGKPLQEEESPWRISPETWVLSAVLVVIGLAVWYMLQPPSADALYERIVQAARSEREDALVDVKDDIEAFLGMYSSDPRAREVEKYLEEVRLHQLQRRLTLQAKRLTRARELSPVVSAYLEAIRLASQDPTEAVIRLEALLALYGDESLGISTDDQRCLKLAQRQLRLLRTQAERFRKQHLEAIAQQLHRARELASTDPEQARRICRALVELYSQKRWAAQAIEEARQLAEKLDSLAKAPSAKAKATSP